MKGGKKAGRYPGKRVSFNTDDTIAKSVKQEPAGGFPRGEVGVATAVWGFTGVGEAGPPTSLLPSFPSSPSPSTYALSVLLFYPFVTLFLSGNN